MADEEDSDEKFEAQESQEKQEDSESYVFGGQVPRAATQVTGLTNIEKAKTLMTLSTSKVQTKPTGHSKPSPYVPDSDLFKFSNPDRHSDDLDIAQNQIYNNEPINVNNNNNNNANMIASNPTFTRPTAARNHGSNNTFQARYAQHFTFKGDNNTQIRFGHFENKSSCCLLIFSSILSLLFIYVSIVFFPQFSPADCRGTCIHSEIPNKSISGIMKKEITLISTCMNSYLMFSLINDETTNNDETTKAYTFSELKDLKSQEMNEMYIGSTDTTNSNENIFDCWNEINISNNNNDIMNGYVFIDYNEYVWEWTISGWYLILSIIMSLFFILVEWLFYSYNEIMIPRKDYRAYIMWYLIRIGWMSFMFTIIIAHSLMIYDNITYIIGSFDYVWIKANCFIATGYVGLFILICLCCCCFQESDGFNGNNPFSNPDEFGFERYFLPQSRIDMRVINDFEQGLGTAMCTTMIFVIGFIICGFIPFIEFLNGGLSGYTYFPYIVSIWFLAIVTMTFQMCWFVRAKCCGDDEDKRIEHVHEQQIRRAGTVP